MPVMLAILFRTVLYRGPLAPEEVDYVQKTFQATQLCKEKYGLWWSTAILTYDQDLSLHFLYNVFVNKQMFVLL